MTPPTADYFRSVAANHYPDSDANKALNAAALMAEELSELKEAERDAHQMMQRATDAAVQAQRELAALRAPVEDVEAQVFRAQKKDVGGFVDYVDAVKATVARSLARINREQAERIDGALTLLREGANGFGRVLVATSDQDATYDWLKRCRKFIETINATIDRAKEVKCA